MATGPHEAQAGVGTGPAPIRRLDSASGPVPTVGFAAQLQYQKQVAIQPADHDLTVIVPAYNEELRLPHTLDGLDSYLGSWGLDYRSEERRVGKECRL